MLRGLGRRVMLRRCMLHRCMLRRCMMFGCMMLSGTVMFGSPMMLRSSVMLSLMSCRRQLFVCLFDERLVSGLR